MSIRERVRALFLRAKDTYTFPEAAALLGWQTGEVDTAVAQGTIAPTKASGGLAIAWEEIATLLTAMYPQSVIEEALGMEGSEVIPELVRLAELRVHVPRFEVVMLRKLADREKTSIDDLLASHLLDLASAEGEWLDVAIPGFQASLRWPEH